MRTTIDNWYKWVVDMNKKKDAQRSLLTVMEIEPASDKKGKGGMDSMLGNPIDANWTDLITKMTSSMPLSIPSTIQLPNMFQLGAIGGEEKIDIGKNVELMKKSKKTSTEDSFKLTNYFLEGININQPMDLLRSILSIKVLSNERPDLSRLLIKELTNRFNIDPQFVEREMGLLTALLDGTALDHHMELSYYRALEKSFRHWRDNNSEVGEDSAVATTTDKSSERESDDKVV